MAIMITPPVSSFVGTQTMAKMQVSLVKKIEELTLYVIDLKKENEEIKKELKQLKENE